MLVYCWSNVWRINRPVLETSVVQTAAVSGSHVIVENDEIGRATSRGPSTTAFHARVRGSVPGLGGLKETNKVSSPSTCESQYYGQPP